MLKSIGYTGVQVSRNSRYKLRSQVLSDDVAAEWEGKPRLLKPPLAHVCQQVKPAVLEGELTLVNEETRIDVPSFDHVLDLIEGHGDRDEVRLPQPEGEVRGCQRAGNGDSTPDERLTRSRLARDQTRAVPVAHRCSVWQERVAASEVRVRVDRHRGDLELPPQRAAVERLDVLELMFVFDSAGVNFPGGQRVEHEGVVGIGRVRDADDAGSAHRGTSTRATSRAASISARCRVYSARFRRRSAGSAAMRRRSAAVAADSLPARRAARIARTRPSR